MSVNEKMTAIADTIRSLSTVTGKVGLDDMPKGISEVWDNGHMYGWDEGYWNGWDEGLEQGIQEGQQAEYDRFWDAFQQNGNRGYWSYAFYGGYGWTDEIFNPKYPFVIKTGGNQMFWQTGLTSIKVPIDLSQTETVNHVGLFGYSKKLVTIPKLIVNETNNYNDDFANCTALKNITFEGTIGRSINLQWSPLTVESILNIVSHLQCYLNTDYDGTYSFLLSKACWDAIDEYERDNGLIYPDTNLGLREYVQAELGWLTA